MEEGLKEPCDKAPNCDEHATAERREYLDICEECQGRQDLIVKRANIVRGLDGEQVGEVEVEVGQPNTENVGQVEAGLGEKIVEHDGQDTDTAQAPPKLKDVDGKWFYLLRECCDLIKGPRPVRWRRGEEFPRRGRTYPADDVWMY